MPVLLESTDHEAEPQIIDLCAAKDGELPDGIDAQQFLTLAVIKSDQISPAQSGQTTPCSPKTPADRPS